MAVAWDSTGAGIANSAYASAATCAHTISSSSPVTVVCGIAIRCGTTASWASVSPTAITFGGTAMNFLGAAGNNTQTLTVNTTGWVALYSVTWTGSGSKTLSITDSGIGDFWANSVAYTGVTSLGTPVGNHGSSTNPTSGAIPSATGHMVVSILGTNNVAVSANTGGTSRYTQSGTTTIESGYLQDAPGVAGGVTFGCTAATAAWGSMAVDLMIPAVSNLFFPFLTVAPLLLMGKPSRRYATPKVRRSIRHLLSQRDAQLVAA